MPVGSFLDARSSPDPAGHDGGMQDHDDHAHPSPDDVEHEGGPDHHGGPAHNDDHGHDQSMWT